MSAGAASGERLRLLVFEPEHSGHRLTGVRVLLDALRGIPDFDRHVAGIALATSAAARRSVEFEGQLADVAHGLDVREVPAAPDGLGALDTARHRAAALREALRAAPADHLYVPWGDGLLQLLTASRFLPGGVRLPRRLVSETIMMRAPFGHEGTPLRVGLPSRLAVSHSPFSRVHLIDPAAHASLLADRYGATDRVRLLPDPITPTRPMARDRARAALGLPEGGRMIGCVGPIGERKGTDRLLAGFLDAALEPDDTLLLAGAHTASMRELVARAARSHPHRRVVSIDRYLSEAELSEAVCALDAMAALYPRFNGSASIVLRAAAVGRLSLGSDRGWMGTMIPRFGLGHVCDVEDRAGLGRAVEDALAASARFELPAAGRAFVDYGAISNTRAHWTALLRERLGLAPDPAMRPFPAPGAPAPAARPHDADSIGQPG